MNEKPAIHVAVADDYIDADVYINVGGEADWLFTVSLERATGAISDAAPRFSADSGEEFAERTDVPAEVAATFQGVRDEVAALLLGYQALPDNGMLILKVQHSNMAPKDAPLPSKWWYRDSPKGWDYLTSDGYEVYLQIEKDLPHVVKHHKQQTSNAIRANFASQMGPVLGLIREDDKKPESVDPFAGMKVRTLVGAQQAYACIELPGRSMDVALSPGKSAAESLKLSAQELRAKAAKDLERAELMEAAAGALA